MEITTLEQAGNHLLQQGVVDFNRMIVVGGDLLNVCGYSYHKKNKTDKIKVQINKHNLQEGEDFTIDKTGAWVYEFTMNAANHILLAAMTDQGKQARQEAINTQVAVDSSEELRQMLFTVIQSQKDIIQLQEDILTLLESKSTSLLKDEDNLIIKKYTHLPLSELLGNGSSKVVQSANLWLEDEGYQVMRFEDGEPAGWELTDKGRNLGTQVNPSSIFWIPEIKMELPTTHTLLEFAERLGLRDMKAQA